MLTEKVLNEANENRENEAFEILKTTLETSGEDGKNTLETSEEDRKIREIFDNNKVVAFSEGVNLREVIRIKTTLQTSGEDAKITLQTGGEDPKITLQTSGEDAETTLQTGGEDDFISKLLKEHFNFDKFREHQLESIKSSSTLVSSVVSHLPHSFRV